MCLRTFSDYRPPSFLESKTRLERLLCEMMGESLSEESWLSLLPRPARLTSVFSIVLVGGLTKLSIRPLGLFRRTSYISSLLTLSEKGVISKAMT